MTSELRQTYSTFMSKGFGIAQLMFARYKNAIFIFIALILLRWIMSKTSLAGYVAIPQPVVTLTSLRYLLIFSAGTFAVFSMGMGGALEVLPSYLLVRPIQSSLIAFWTLLWASTAVIGIWFCYILFAVQTSGTHLLLLNYTFTLLILTACSIALTWLWSLLPFAIRYVSPTLFLLPFFPSIDKMALNCNLYILLSIVILAFCVAFLIAVKVIQVVRVGGIILSNREAKSTSSNKTNSLKNETGAKSSIVTHCLFELSGSWSFLLMIVLEMLSFTYGLHHSAWRLSIVAITFLPIAFLVNSANPKLLTYSGQFKSFFVVKPLSSFGFVNAIGLAALVRAVSIWTVIMFYLFVQLKIDGGFLAAQLMPHLNWLAWLIMPLVGVVLYWKAQMAYISCSLTGRPWVKHLANMMLFSVLLIVGTLVKPMISNLPTIVHWSTLWGSWVLGLICLLKIGFIVFIFALLIRSHLLSTKTSVAISLGWFTVAGLITILICYEAPLIPKIVAILASILFLPATTFQVPILAFMWNRHQ